MIGNGNTSGVTIVCRFAQAWKLLYICPDEFKFNYLCWNFKVNSF